MCPKPPVASAKAECARRRGHQDQAGHEQDGEGRRLKTRLLARTYDLQLASCCTGCDGCPSAPSRIDGGAHFTLGPVAKARRVCLAAAAVAPALPVSRARRSSPLFRN